MTTQTVTSFEIHFDQFLANRKSGALTRVRQDPRMFERELADMQIAADTLINDYRTIHADSDPIESAVLMRSALSSMRKYFTELVQVMD